MIPDIMPDIILADISLAAILLWTAIMVGASYLGGLLFKAKTPKAEEPVEGVESRMWRKHTTQQEGIARPRAYGKNMHHGNIIGKWTDATYNREVLYLLIDHGDGPTKGVADLATDVFLNNQPVSNFTSVETQQRLGTMNQTCMIDFDKQKLEYVINNEMLKDEPVIFTTPNDFFDDIQFTIVWPSGLYRRGRDGDIKLGYCRVRVRIREHGEEEWAATIYNKLHTPKVTHPLFLACTVSDLWDNVEKGKQYDLEFTNLTGTIDRHVNNISVRSVREVVNTAFTHPGRALVGIRAVATTRLSGNLDVKIIREDRIVWNGATDTLEYNNNRAWVTWDLLTLPSIDGDGTGPKPYVRKRFDGIDPQYLDLEFFKEWATFCKEGILSGYGVGTEPRAPCNIIIDAFTNVFKKVQDIAAVGRAHLYWAGHLFSGWIDKATTDPIDLVTTDSMLHKTWKNNWAIKKELAGVMEVLYEDEKQGYERTAAEWANEDAGGFRNIVSVEGVGLKTRGTAIHYAAYLLECNHLIRNVNSFDVAKDGFTHKLGKVLRIQNRTANWGKAFRVMSATIDTVTVDRNAESEINIGDALYIRSYSPILKRRETDIYEVDSVSENVITVTENWDISPSKGNLIAVGNVVLRRITKLTSKSNNLFSVEVETYDTDLFKTDEINPNNPNQNYIWPGAVVDLSSLLTPDEIQERIEQSTVPLAYDEIPTPSNLSWNDDDPNVGDISWSKTDADDDITIRYRGESYTIAAGSTDKEFVYWDVTADAGLAFQTTPYASVAMAPGCWLIRINEGGEALPAWGQWVIKTPVIGDEAVSADAYTYTEGKLPLIYGSFYQTVWVIYTATGRSIRIQCSCIFEGLGADNKVPIQVQRTGGEGGSVYFIQSQESLTLLQDSVINVAFDVVDDSLVSGVEYTYSMRARKGLDVGNINACNRTMSVTELKK